MLPKVTLVVWFLSSIGANALQATLTLSFGGRGLVPDRKGLNVSSIYGTNWCVRQAARPSWHCLPLWCFHICWSPNPVVETSPCMLLIRFQPAQNVAFHKYMHPVCLPSHVFLFPNSQLIPSCGKHRVFTGTCNLCACRPIFSSSLILNLFQTAKIILQFDRHETALKKKETLFLSKRSSTPHMT